MSEKYCCVTWSELGPELIQEKSNAIDAQIKELSLPRSIFASVIKVLNGMLNYCPVCGECLNNELLKKPINVKPERHSPPTEVVDEEEDTGTKKLSGNVPRTCNGCAGKGVLGCDQNGVKINCMKCHGTGKFIPATHDCKYNERLATNAENKVTNLRAKLDIGDNPVQGDTE